MTSMLKFLKRKIKPFKKCTGNPSYSFEVVDSATNATNNKPEFNTYIDSNDYTDATCSSQINQTSRFTKRSFFRFHRRKSQSKQSHSLNTNSSLNNREATNSLMATTTCHLLPEDDEMGIDTGLPQFDTPTSSLNSHNEWQSNSYSDDMYSDEDCIQDLINHTNHHNIQVSSKSAIDLIQRHKKFQYFTGG